MVLAFVNISLQKKVIMLNNYSRVTISSMILWRADSMKTAVLLMGMANGDCEKGVFVDKAFFEPFYIPEFVAAIHQSKVIPLFNKN